MPLIFARDLEFGTLNCKYYLNILAGKWSKIKEWVIFVDHICDKKVEGTNKYERFLQVLDSAIFIFLVDDHEDNKRIGSTCMKLEGYDHSIRLRQLQRKRPKQETGTMLEFES